MINVFLGMNPKDFLKDVIISLKTAGKLAEGVVVSTGAAVAVSVIGAGTVLSAAGHVIAFIPNEVGMALLYNEKVSR